MPNNSTTHEVYEDLDPITGRPRKVYRKVMPDGSFVQYAEPIELADDEISLFEILTPLKDRGSA